MADRIAELQARIHEGLTSHDAGGVARACREVLDHLRKASQSRSDPEPDDGDEAYATLWRLGADAMAMLGGQAEPALASVGDYDHEEFGPLLGVSDEGSATKAIRQGGLASPKCQVLRGTGRLTPLAAGIAHDAERLGGVGEVAVGPDEYATIRLACRDRILTSTNIGTQVNLRDFLPPAVVRVPTGAEMELVAKTEHRLAQEFKPFLDTPNRRARAQTVYIQFDPKWATRQRAAILKRLVQAVAKGSFAQRAIHRLGLFVQTTKPRHVQQTSDAIDLASRAGVDEVAVEGQAKKPSRSAGLLDYFEPGQLAKLLQTASAKGIALRRRSRVDPQTTARHVWTGLSVARHMGLELGKYGLVPLTFEEQHEVIARIQYWMMHWCAAPVYFVDHPLVTRSDVFDELRITKAIRLWLNMTAKLGVRVVLIDTSEKSQKRRILKDFDGDTLGFLTAKDIAAISTFAYERGVKILWAGGITLPQAFTFGKLGVFGVYVTSAAAVPVAVAGSYRKDRALAAAREPERDAVARVKLLLEAGFLSQRRKSVGDTAKAEEIAGLAKNVANLNDPEMACRAAAALHALLLPLWREHLRFDETRAVHGNIT